MTPDAARALVSEWRAEADESDATNYHVEAAALRSCADRLETALGPKHTECPICGRSETHSHPVL